MKIIWSTIILIVLLISTTIYVIKHDETINTKLHHLSVEKKNMEEAIISIEAEIKAELQIQNQTGAKKSLYYQKIIKEKQEIIKVLNTTNRLIAEENAALFFKSNAP